ncbi:MAG TPA: aminodeoxychorismate synthase component I [Spirochaetota bacterium]|nr:aminodeoxychorismate synthase component I [Spirochaetota bacterium]
MITEKDSYYRCPALFDAINNLAVSRIPFFCLISAFADYGYLFPLDNKEACPIVFSFCGNKISSYDNNAIITNFKPPLYNRYQSAFDKVQQYQYDGCTYLVNLTFTSDITLSGDLYDIYNNSQASYRILFPERFVCFSPECFIKIRDGRIITYPMKGTIDASIKDAESILINDQKEEAEHITIVDLLRNDLSRVADDVQVDQYRYIQKIMSRNGALYQTSSCISGVIGGDWHGRLGSILQQLLPAGSVTGAPKKKTVQIIQEVEDHERGFYTGIAGFYDGSFFDSAVLIRYIEKTDRGYIYKSGGGVTIYSDADSEYKELINKIYV